MVYAGNNVILESENPQKLATEVVHCGLEWHVDVWCDHGK